MSFQDVLQLSGAIFIALGGGGALVFSLSSWLGKVWANRLMIREVATHAQDLAALQSRLTQDVESYKIRLKKSELIFQKEYEAASEFVELFRSFIPTYRYPEMDWYDACDEIAQDFSNIEKTLSNYLSKHGAVLSEDVRNSLCLCIGISGKSKFEVEGPEVPRPANEAADDVHKKLHSIEQALLSRVHSQISI